MIVRTHQITINNHKYLVHGTNTESLIEIAKTIGLEYDEIETTPIPENNKIIKVWPIGKLRDYIKTIK